MVVAVKANTGVGFTVIVAVIGVPAQLLANGVMVIVAVTGVDPVLIAVNDGMFPAPEAANPIEVLLFVQLNVAPLILDVRVIAEVAEPLHTACVAGVATAIGVGLTVIVAVIAGPKQPPAKGVIVIVAVTGVVPGLTAVKDGTLPLPDAVSPIEVLLLVHVNVVPFTGLVRAIIVLALPLQTVWAGGVATTTGVGLTLIIAVIDCP